ncbi:hypothetical protein [Aquihabitans sp. McL0605]|uniref:hypothetical protein n=1 Tax=Aquihabitans sp. McL0605 TaxID=3415671 RepID=UPI003CFBA58F
MTDPADRPPAARSGRLPTERLWVAPKLAERLAARPVTPEQLAQALAATHAWFEVNSGWAPPDPETMADWADEGSCRAPDECWTPLHGVCRHGLASWQVVLDELADLDAATLHEP